MDDRVFEPGIRAGKVMRMIWKLKLGLMAVLMSWLWTPWAAMAADTPTIPPVPVNFSVQAVDDGNHLALAWQAGGDPTATAMYFLSRSTDNSTLWETLATNLTVTTYQDEQVVPGMHYYYRLAALNAAGAMSDYALADATTAEVLGSSAQATTSFSSSDGVATATVTTGQVSAGVVCSVTGGSKAASSARPVIAGPYRLECQGADGQPLATLTGTVQWRLEPGSRLIGYTTPQVAQSVKDTDALQLANTGQYDDKTHRLTVTLPVNERVAVTAMVPNYAWVNYVAVAGLGAMIVIVLLFWPLRSARRQNYQDYLRSKYYNL